PTPTGQAGMDAAWLDIGAVEAAPGKSRQEPLDLEAFGGRDAGGGMRPGVDPLDQETLAPGVEPGDAAGSSQGVALGEEGLLQVTKRSLAFALALGVAALAHGELEAVVAGEAH